MVTGPGVGSGIQAPFEGSLDNSLANIYYTSKEDMVDFSFVREGVLWSFFREYLDFKAYLASAGNRYAFQGLVEESVLNGLKQYKMRDRDWYVYPAIVANRYDQICYGGIGPKVTSQTKEVQNWLDQPHVKKFTKKFFRDQSFYFSRLSRMASAAFMGNDDCPHLWAVDPMKMYPVKVEFNLDRHEGYIIVWKYHSRNMSAAVSPVARPYNRVRFWMFSEDRGVNEVRDYELYGLGTGPTAGTPAVLGGDRGAMASTFTYMGATQFTDDMILRLLGPSLSYLMAATAHDAAAFQDGRPSFKTTGIKPTQLHPHGAMFQILPNMADPGWIEFPEMKNLEAALERLKYQMMSISLLPEEAISGQDQKTSQDGILHSARARVEYQRGEAQCQYEDGTLSLGRPEGKLDYDWPKTFGSREEEAKLATILYEAGITTLNQALSGVHYEAIDGPEGEKRRDPDAKAMSPMQARGEQGKGFAEGSDAR